MPLRLGGSRGPLQTCLQYKATMSMRSLRVPPALHSAWPQRGSSLLKFPPHPPFKRKANSHRVILFSLQGIQDVSYACTGADCFSSLLRRVQRLGIVMPPVKVYSSPFPNVDRENWPTSWSFETKKFDDRCCYTCSAVMHWMKGSHLLSWHPLGFQDCSPRSRSMRDLSSVFHCLTCQGK